MMGGTGQGGEGAGRLDKESLLPTEASCASHDKLDVPLVTVIPQLSLH